MSPAKTVEPIEMPFGELIYVGPRNHVLTCGVQIPNQSNQSILMQNLKAVADQLNNNKYRLK